MIKQSIKLSVLVLMIVHSFFLNGCLDTSEQAVESQVIFKDLGVFGNTPSFDGVTDANKNISEKDLKGKIWLISFFFASCGDICPRLNAAKSSLIAKIPSDSLRFLSVTVDPETDSPEFLSKYRKEMKFTDNRWSFVRMKNDSILQSFMDGMLVGYTENPENHTARIILIDNRSQIRGYFDALDKQQIDSLESILRKLK
jgi:protein SCO1/2